MPSSKNCDASLGCVPSESCFSLRQVQKISAERLGLGPACLSSKHAVNCEKLLRGLGMWKRFVFCIANSRGETRVSGVVPGVPDFRAGFVEAFGNRHPAWGNRVGASAELDGPDRKFS